MTDTPEQAVDYLREQARLSHLRSRASSLKPVRRRRFANDEAAKQYAARMIGKQTIRGDAFWLAVVQLLER